MQHQLSSRDFDKALHTLGYDGFRPGQREAVETLMQQRRLLLVAPTGGGKSLCYQLPALLFSGTTLVVSPLIALMHDQVSALSARGVAATYLASNLSSSEIRSRLFALRQGAFKLCYVAPERLTLQSFQTLLAQLGAPLIAIDEAHCISEWGHDFRPEYLRIGELIAAVPQARVMACTATATPVVRDEIIARLGLPAGTPQIVRGFARPNLALRVADIASLADRRRHTDTMLHEALGEAKKALGSAIVYAPTRRGCEEEVARLRALGWRCDAYHAKLPGPERDAAQDRFVSGLSDVVVATCAFGMGIDRSDVRAVVHLAPPGSIEAYYQEVGRAGRDGAPAVGLMMLSARDIALRKHLITQGTAALPVTPEVAEHKWGLFLELLRWAEAGTCRHDAILRYFGDEGETLGGCGRCDMCQMLDAGEVGLPREACDLYARKALSAVARIHNRFGVGAAVQLLRGSKDKRLLSAGLTQTKTFGILADMPEAWILQLLRRCITAGFVDLVGGDRPVAVLTPMGTSVMRGDVPSRMVLWPPRAPKASPAAAASAKKTGASSRSQPDVSHILSPAALQTFEALRAFRLEAASQEGVPPYVIASDRTLREIAQRRPKNLAALLEVHGIGQAKATKWGPALLAIVAANAAA